MVVERFDVCLITLDPTIGSEIRKTRPCVIVSPESLNRFLNTVIIAPMTTQGKLYSCRVLCRFQNKDAKINLDQLRTVDKMRLVKRLGRIDATTQKIVLEVLQEIFRE